MPVALTSRRVSNGVPRSDGPDRKSLHPAQALPFENTPTSEAPPYEIRKLFRSKSIRPFRVAAGWSSEFRQVPIEGVGEIDVQCGWNLRRVEGHAPGLG